MKFLLLFVAAVLATVTAPVEAAPTTICYDNNTLLTTYNITLCAPTCETWTRNETERCARGCDNATLACAPTTFYGNFVILGLIVFFILLIAVAWKWGRA